MKRILFVDDDVALLDGLRARLYRRRTEWHMTFVASAAAAIEYLERQPADLVISDVRMPSIDGSQLLATLKDRWPETIRIVMSGHANSEQLMRLIATAHQYVSKPCDAQLLENMIDRCLHLDSLLNNEHVRAVVGRIGALPTMPATYSRLQTALSNPNANAAEVAAIVASDAVVAVKVLQVANSAFFRLAKPMSSIKEAVAYLGFTSLRNLVMSAEIFSQWEKLKAPPGLEAERLQAHAQLAAAACIALAVDTPLKEDALLAGLIHDIGYWILIQECPDDLKRALALSHDEGIDSETAERRVIGAAHAEVGAYLLGLWGLPYSLIEAVAFHHSPHSVPQRQYDLLAILATAHSLLPTSGPAALLVASEIMSVVDNDYLQRLHAPFDWQEARRRVDELSGANHHGI